MNAKGSRTAVEPLYDPRDVLAMGDYLRQQDAAREQPAYIVWLLCVHGGFRIGDVLQLRVCQVCGKGKFVRDHIEIREEKRGKVVKRGIPAPVKAQLQAYVNRLDWQRVKYQSFVFESHRNQGKPYSYQWMNERIKEAAAVCGINQRVTTHTMRKTFAFHWYKNNKDDRSLFATEKEALQYLSNDILKHGSTAETLRYIGINQELVDRTTAKVVFVPSV